MASKGERCPLVEYCGKYTTPEQITVYDCTYKSDEDLCFKGVVFDVGPKVMDKLRERNSVEARKTE